MKIIKKGNIPSRQIWRGRCFSCISEMECLLSEIDALKTEYTDARQSLAFKQCTCPVCKAPFRMCPTTEYEPEPTIEIRTPPKEFGGQSTP